MTRVKFCGLSREEDIIASNELMPEYIGFIFWEKSKRYVSPTRAEALRKILSEKISPVGVFVNDKPENIASLVRSGIIDIIQLHGQEDEEYITNLRSLTDAKIIKAFIAGNMRDTTADYVMIDSGMGTGHTLDWQKIPHISQPFFLAGGLNPENVSSAINTLHPFAVDVSSGIETQGFKDKSKMAAFIQAVRKENS